MENEGLRAEAAVRFARDLQRIREARNRSLEDIHAETKAPLDLIEQFERSALLDHPMYNHVYLRSFVRSYAEVLEISAVEVLKALDAVVEGRYEDQLAVRYLGEKKAQRKKAPAKPAGKQPPVPEKSPPPAPVASTSEPEPRSPELVPEPEKKMQPVPPLSAPPDSIRKRHSAIGGGSLRQASTRSVPLNTVVIAGAGIIIILILAVYWFFLREDPAESPQVQEVVVDTVSTPPPPQASPPIILGDTMQVFIVAATNKVEGIRVKVDEGVRAPFWIEQGDSLGLLVQDRVTLENMLRRILVSVDGYRYPLNPPDATGPVVITREAVEAYLNRNRP